MEWKSSTVLWLLVLDISYLWLTILGWVVNISGLDSGVLYLSMAYLNSQRDSVGR